MKKMKPPLNRLMITGLTTGMLMTQFPYLSAKDADKPKSLMELAEENDGNTTYHLMTEDELLLQLNDEGTKIYKTLSPEGKKLALETASRSCNGTNSCKGLNACKTDKNDCAGKSSCKGTSKCALADPNVAVKLVQKKMEAKRLETQNGENP